MFRYEYPQFEKKRILRVEMLEQLRDYPKEYIQLSFRGYSDGVVNGCEITWDDGRLTIAPGIVHRNGNLYFMEKPYTLDCFAEDKNQYLKVQFLTEINEAGKIVGNTRIILDGKMPDIACEIELCRFRLQEGARLRDSHENFEDYITEYDTVNLIHAPFAAKGKSTLNPIILMQFATETMNNHVLDPYDISFAMNVMANNGVIPAECIRQYLNIQLDGMVKAEENQNLYRGLLKVLREQERGSHKAVKGGQKRKSVMLV